MLSAPTIVIVYFTLDWKFVNAQVSDVKAAKILFQFLVGQKRINPAIFRKIINPLISHNFSQPWLSQKLKNNFMIMSKENDITVVSISIGNLKCDFLWFSPSLGH